MNSTTVANMELSAILNNYVYLDDNTERFKGKTLGEILEIMSSESHRMDHRSKADFQQITAALEAHEEWKDVELVDMSAIEGAEGQNTPDNWKDDMIEAATFKDKDNNYYVVYRGTGDGRWEDNGHGMTVADTPMQESSLEYFDKVFEEIIQKDTDRGKVIITGHSKGGNQAQYVTAVSDYRDGIDECHSFDGQGFSKKFLEKYKDNLTSEQLAKMYSICGSNDYVHGLGKTIIPEENTYFVDSTGVGMKDWHQLPSMLGEENNKQWSYTGIRWYLSDGEITHGEEGPVSLYIRQLSEKMMSMDEENLHGSAVAVMFLIDYFASEEEWKVIGGDKAIEPTPADVIDLIARGLPKVAESFLLTEEGRKLLLEAINAGLNEINNKFGIAGAAGATVLVGLLIIPAVKLVGSVVVFAKILDQVIGFVEKLKGFTEDVGKFLSHVKTAAITAFKNFTEWVRRQTPGGRYASDNTLIKLNTQKLRDYADRITKVNTRLGTLDRNINGLYRKAGFLDLWNLIQADLLTGYSYRLTRCIGYLKDTANDFETAERNISKHMM